LLSFATPGPAEAQQEEIVRDTWSGGCRFCLPVAGWQLSVAAAGFSRGIFYNIKD